MALSKRNGRVESLFDVDDLALLKILEKKSPTTIKLIKDEMNISHNSYLKRVRKLSKFDFISLIKTQTSKFSEPRVSISINSKGRDLLSLFILGDAYDFK